MLLHYASQHIHNTHLHGVLLVIVDYYCYCYCCTHELLIAYWDRILSALMALGGDTRTTLTQGFWPQNCLMVVESDTMFSSNGDVREEFAMDEHYVGPTRNQPARSFCVGVDCHEGYMVLA